MASVYSSVSHKGTIAKLTVSAGDLQPFIAINEPPWKKSPWRPIKDMPFVYYATMILPEELYDLVWEKVQSQVSTPKYAKVMLKIQDLLEKEFLHRYVKKGRLFMISEGDPGVDNTFSLHNGTLRLNLNRETYERTGLQGTVVQSGGRKHTKTQHLVEIDLRLPSMQHGKKGFERVLYAARNVLNNSLMWLCGGFDENEIEPSEGRERETIDPFPSHHPTFVSVNPKIETIASTTVPDPIQHPLRLSDLQKSDDETLYDIAEWLDLVALSSPRVRADDKVDPLICQYAPPGTGTEYLIHDNVGLGVATPESVTRTKISNLKVIKFTGLLGSDWLSRILATVIKLSRGSMEMNNEYLTPWFAMTVSSHRINFNLRYGSGGGSRPMDGYTILLQAGSGKPGNANAEAEPQDEVPEDKMDITIIKDSKQNGQAQTQDASQSRKGLQRFLCFEHYDAIK